MPHFVLPISYRASAFFFEVVEYVLQKAVLVGILVFFDPGSIGQLVLGLLVCFLYSCLVCHIMPYTEPSDNVLAIATQFSLFLTMLMSVAVRDESFNDEAPPSSVVSILLLSAIVPVVIAVLVTARELWHKVNGDKKKKPKPVFLAQSTGPAEVKLEDAPKVAEKDETAESKGGTLTA